VRTSKHSDAFYVLEGELTFEVGHEAETITLSSGGFVAVPPEVAQSFRTRRLPVHSSEADKITSIDETPATTRRLLSARTRPRPPL
jgi:hypothetical protein